MDYRELVDRNWFFIDRHGQEQIAEANVLLLGCGLGGVIAESLVRLGFQNFTLVDRDVVEMSNLNRQPFGLADIGKSKAEVLAAGLRSINSSISVQAIVEEFARIPEQFLWHEPSTIVVNTLDIDSSYFDATRSAADAGSVVLHPFNVGWGGVLFIVPPDAECASLFEGDLRRCDSDAALLLALHDKSDNIKVPEYLRGRLDVAANAMQAQAKNSQLAVASFANAALTGALACQIVQGHEIRVYPSVYQFDAQSC